MSDTVADIQSRLEDLVFLSEDDRAQLRDDITSVYEEAEAEDPAVDEMIQAMTTLNNFETLIEQVDAKAAALADEAAEEAAETEDDAEAAAEADTESEPAMAASAAFSPPDENQPITRSPITTTPVIGADISGFTAGANFRDLNEVNRAFVKKIDQIRAGSGGDNEQRSVVTLLASIADDRQLTYDNTFVNQARIDAATSDTALVASGGYCAPLPVNYDIFGVGSAVRPVRDALPTFGATRGGIRYIAPPLLGAYNNAISLWTAANDANPTDPTVKPSLKVNCASEQTATADAVTLSLVFGNLMTRAFPELVQRHNQLALIQHARFAERTLLNKISAASTAVTTAHNLGAARDLLVSISRASASYRNRHRIPRPITLRAILPEWTRDLVREDIASNLQVENLAVTDATIDSWFAARGLRISWHIDDTFASQTAAAPLNGFPTTIKWWLFAEGTFLFLDGGTLDLGVIRDSTLVGTNDYRTFVETFEGIAKVGIESLEITATTSIAPKPAV